MASYQHTQRAPLCWLLYATAVLCFAFAWQGRQVPVAAMALFCGGLLFVVLAAAFHHLTVEDEGDRLAIRFGPLPLFRRTVRYEDITSVEVGRTTLLDGWGIHYSLRGGWVWNLWGFECAVLQLHRRRLYVGTDDAEGLAAFLNARLESDSFQAHRQNP